jgi:SAM-dependent methyltransferase
MNKSLREINACEVCTSTTLEPVLNLGLHPMCDDLVKIGENRICQKYPIEILFCASCKTAHQRFQIPKELLFPKTYHYRSINTEDVMLGLQDLVMSCVQRLGDLNKKKVLDIGCNDGSLLGFFAQKGASTFGIEPTGACLDAQAAGHEVMCDYLTETSALAFVDKYGRPDLICFTNVFAHIEDLAQVLRSLRILRHSSTYVIIENHYLGAVLKRGQFDTFYHEHPRTYSYSSFAKIAESMGMQIDLVQFPSRYGGNIRVLLKPQGADPVVHNKFKEITNSEECFIDEFYALAKHIEQWQKIKRAEVSEAVRLFGPLLAKAFPGRSAIPLNILGIDETMISAVYEKPSSSKIGHLVPGTLIPILSDATMLRDRSEGSPILNLAWHIKGEIKAYMENKGYQGEYIDII